MDRLAVRLAQPEDFDGCQKIQPKRLIYLPVDIEPAS